MPKTTIPNIHKPSALHAGNCSFSPTIHTDPGGYSTPYIFLYFENNAEQRGDGERRAEMAPNVTPVADGKRIKKTRCLGYRFP